ncbi:hypothetical protein ACLSU7_07310 [Bdellovibrio sp. HCB185ZH]|uniref:hypothetical protein n=1 Tax=Bdellovibrio sp. HCB185ZH TaxID=3394235 RepID=UPI0039A5FA38
MKTLVTLSALTMIAASAGAQTSQNDPYRTQQQQQMANPGTYQGNNPNPSQTNPSQTNPGINRPSPMSGSASAPTNSTTDTMRDSQNTNSNPSNRNWNTNSSPSSNNMPNTNQLPGSSGAPISPGSPNPSSPPAGR